MPLFLLLCTWLITFEIFRIFFLDRGVGGWGVSYSNFFGFLYFFKYLQGPLVCISSCADVTRFVLMCAFVLSRFFHFSSHCSTFSFADVDTYELVSDSPEST